MKQYSKIQVSVATFLGAPIAGAVLMGLNSARNGSEANSRNCILYGLMGTVALMVIGFFLPESFPNMIIPIASVAVVQVWYQKTQEEAYKRHLESGGQKGTWLSTVGIGIGCLIGVLAVMFGVIMLLPERLFE